MANEMLKAVIEVDGARVSFGAVKALDGVTLSVMPGECIGLVGHNGAGKSTIVNVINGGLTPQEGTVASDGERLDRYNITIARGRGGALRLPGTVAMPQSFHRREHAHHAS